MAVIIILAHLVFCPTAAFCSGFACEEDAMKVELLQTKAQLKREAEPLASKVTTYDARARTPMTARSNKGGNLGPEDVTMDCSQIGSNGLAPETNCPKAKWVDEMVRVDPSRGKTILNIGCNKGNDAVHWMELWDMSATKFWSQTDWIDQVDKTLSVAPKVIEWYACEPDKEYVTASMVEPRPPKNTTSSLQTGGCKSKQTALPIGVCVEPMPNNVRLLNTVSEALGYQPETPLGSFHIVQAAAVAEASPGETQPFPDMPVGYEQASLGDEGVFPEVPVSVKTVDTIMEELSLCADILIIDTEGWDAEVLKGAKRTLAKVRYLEFEVHRDKDPWSSTSLRSVVDDLDEQGFDCYWAGNDGKLTAIKACWSDGFEAGIWGNAACAKRSDVWSKVLQEFAASSVLST